MSSFLFSLSKTVKSSLPLSHLCCLTQNVEIRENNFQLNAFLFCDRLRAFQFNANSLSSNCYWSVYYCSISIEMRERIDRISMLIFHTNEEKHSLNVTFSFSLPHFRPFVGFPILNCCAVHQFFRIETKYRSIYTMTFSSSIKCDGN